MFTDEERAHYRSWAQWEPGNEVLYNTVTQMARERGNARRATEKAEKAIKQAP